MDSFIFGRREDAIDEGDDVLHLIFLDTTSSDSRRTDTDTRGLESRAAIEGNHILVHRDVAATRAFSATLPVSSGNLPRRSMSMQWLSVPPDTTP